MSDYFCTMYLALKGHDNCNHMFKKGQTNQPVQLVSLASVGSKSNRVASLYWKGLCMIDHLDFRSSWHYVCC